MIFKNFADQDWIGFNFIGSGLDLDRKISQSAHLCSVANMQKYDSPYNDPSNTSVLTLTG